MYVILLQSSFPMPHSNEKPHRIGPFAVMLSGMQNPDKAISLHIHESYHSLDGLFCVYAGLQSMNQGKYQKLETTSKQE